MHTTRSSSLLRSPSRALLGAALTLYACSFKDLDYLQEGSAEGGKASGGGQSESGGRDPSGGAGHGGGGASGGRSSGGAGGSGGDAGHAGDVGSGGQSGGGGGEGGASTAGAAGEGGAGGGIVATGGVGASGGVGGSGGADEPGGAGGSGGDAPIVGNQLKNPSFETQLTGWTVDPASAIANRYVYTQPPSGGSTAVDGGYVLATWHATAEYTVLVSQTVSGLPDGNYTFTANFASLQSRGAYMFHRNCGGPEQQLVIPTNTDQWFALSMPISVTGGSCEVGFSVHGVGGDWLNADMFTFEKDP